MNTQTIATPHVRDWEEVGFGTPLWTVCPSCQERITYVSVAAVTEDGRPDGIIAIGLPAGVMDDYRRECARPFSGLDVPGSTPPVSGRALNGSITASWRAVTALGYQLPRRSMVRICPTTGAAIPSIALGGGRIPSGRTE